MMINIEPFYAHISNNPLACAFEEEQKVLPSVDKAKMGMGPMPKWEGGKFEDFAPEAYMANTERPLTLYLHVPFCHHRCTFCPFYSNLTNKTFSESYATLLSKEIEDTAQILRHVIHQRPVKAVYFGGGTPSDLDCDDLAKLISQVRDTFPMSDDVEFTIEGRVRGFTPDKGKAWFKAGANRFSLGIQTTDTALRRRIGRLADQKEMKEILNGLCDSNATVVVDLMYGFPDQTPVMMEEDIRFLTEETGIHALDLYELKLFPDSPLEKAVKRGKLGAIPNLSAKAALYEAAYNKLVSYHYEQFTARHWRRDTRELSIYNRFAGKVDMIPFGSGGGGRLGDISLGNTSVLEDYSEMVSRGEKPLKRLVRMPAASSVNSFSKLLDNAMEKMKLPALTQWPSSHRPQAEQLLTQWQQAGLLNFKENDKEDIPLTCAGNFWAPKIRKLLLEFTAK